jgi:hypothetical protein
VRERDYGEERRPTGHGIEVVCALVISQGANGVEALL